MSVSIAASWLLAIALCCVRVGMVLVMTPLLGGAQLPARVRLFLVLAVAVVFSPQLNVGLLTASGDVPFIILMSVNEVIWEPCPTRFEPERGAYFQRGMSLSGELGVWKGWVDHHKDGGQHGRIKAVND